MLLKRAMNKEEPPIVVVDVETEKPNGQEFTVQPPTELNTHRIDLLSSHREDGGGFILKLIIKDQGDTFKIKEVAPFIAKCDSALYIKKPTDMDNAKWEKHLIRIQKSMSALGISVRRADTDG